MESQELKVARNRRGRPRTTGQGMPLQLRVHSDVLDPLDAWIEAQPDPTITRQQAILKILRHHLKIK